MSDGDAISGLIRDLGSDLRPVRRLPPPWLRAAVWLGAFAVVALVVS